MSIAEKLVTIAENEPKVYQAGYSQGNVEGLAEGYNSGYEFGKQDGIQVEYDRFWDTVQNNGNPADYSYRFYNFPAVLFDPKYDFVFSGVEPISASFTFRLLQATDMKKNCDFTRLQHMQYTFYQTNLKNARTIKLSPENVYKDTFSHSVNLEEIRIEGEIGQNGLSFLQCTKLTHESLMSIINALQDKSADTSGTSWLITLGSANIAKLSEDEKAIMDNKGWDYL